MHEVVKDDGNEPRGSWGGEIVLNLYILLLNNIINIRLTCSLHPIDINLRQESSYFCCKVQIKIFGLFKGSNYILR